jgi:hypothetical protein
MKGKARFHLFLAAVLGLALMLPTFAIANEAGLPESAAIWLAAWKNEPEAETRDRRALREAEARVFDFIERGTGNLVAEPHTSAERAAVGHHLTLLAEVLTEPEIIRHLDGSVSINHGQRFASGQVPIEEPDGRITLRCVSVREQLLGRVDPARFPGFLTREVRR